MPYCPKVQFEGELPSPSSIYQPLGREEFRLLQAHGYDGYGILRCSLRHVPFAYDTIIPYAYAATSYTWNEAEKLWYGEYDASPKPTRIDSVAVSVPDKVANIICLSEQHGKQFIWIDAICINQTDLDENGHQVVRMGKIYGHASEGLSFLGGPNRETDDLIDQTNNYFGASESKPKVPAKTMFAMLNLFANSYWRLAWIFQEIALARSIAIFCGSRVAPLDAIFELMKNMSGLTKMDGVRGTLRAIYLLHYAGSTFSRIWKNRSIDGMLPA